MILGIDLGTSNSMAAAFRDGELVLVCNAEGSHIIPSVVSVDEDGNIYTGDMALKRKKKHPDMTVEMFKRGMGTDREYVLGDRSYSAEELSAILLRTIKREAENFFGEEIRETVISVPAFFNHFQRESVMQAGKQAGFEVKRIINEPTAAAMAYGVQNNEEAEKKIIIVLDMGGGTFDISVMEVNGNIMEVVAICGDNHMGGGDFTQRLIELFREYNAVEEELTVEEKSNLWEAAENAKRRISVEGAGEIKCTIGGREYGYTVTEQEYENACFDLLEKIRKLTLQAMEESEYEPHEVKDVIMVGGGTRLSIVKKMIEKMTGREIEYRINPDEAVARGAALQGALLGHDEDVEQIVMTDICSHYIGSDAIDGCDYDIGDFFDVIIKKNTTIPVRKTISHYSAPGTCRFDVWQCENSEGIGATLLDTFKYAVPDLGDDEDVEVQHSIIYNANGMIYAEVLIPATGMKYTKAVQVDGAEVMETVQKEGKDSSGTANPNEDTALMARADRAYAEAVGKDRESIGDYIKNYEDALRKGKSTAIEKAKEALVKVLDAYESSIGEL